ncbi:unnamed protein product [Parnassius apollo]|uniref:(apollo) hypothetical protein n=1 Tax=Parnassius apollo TaxID=110799 RepID=A0A8S3YB80_PARAO|nr:unnamed protein product [Parnassius apollo]
MNTSDNQDHTIEFTEKDPLNENFEKPKPVEKKTVKETLLYIFNNVTVEPTMFLFVSPALLTILTSQNFGLEKACRVNLNFTTEICDSLRAQNIESQNEFERDTQKLFTYFMAWKTYLSSAIPCALALFIGSWSDKTGRRKVFILIPIAGQILVCINGLLNTYFFCELRLEHFVLIEGLLEGFTGGWCISFVAIYSYISAITTTETRTFRMGLVNFSFSVAFPVGMSLSGIFLKNYGFYGCYGLSCGLHAANFIYNFIYLKDTAKSEDQRQVDGGGFRKFFREFFDLTNVKETFKTIFKQGSNNRRARIIILLIVVAILFGPIHGEIATLYISTRYRFNWDEVKFSIFQTYNFVTHTIGTLFSLAVFNKYLGWHDSILGIISTVSKILASFLYCFAPNEQIFFLAPLVEILSGTSLLALRSILSKLAAAHEFGKINSLFEFTENLMPLVYVPLYTKTYAATMEVLPGAVFLLGASMTLPALCVFTWFLYEHRRNLEKSAKQNNADKITSYQEKAE